TITNVTPTFSITLMFDVVRSGRSSRLSNPTRFPLGTPDGEYWTYARAQSSLVAGKPVIAFVTFVRDEKPFVAQPLGYQMGLRTKKALINRAAKPARFDCAALFPEDCGAFTKTSLIMLPD